LNFAQPWPKDRVHTQMTLGWVQILVRSYWRLEKQYLEACPASCLAMDRCKSRLHIQSCHFPCSINYKTVAWPNRV